MGTAALIAAIVSIVVGLASGGVTAWQTILQGFNQSTKNKVLEIVSLVNKEIAAKRMSLSKIVNALNSKANRASLDVLYQNPVISKSLKDLNADQDFIADITSRQGLLEQEIQSLTDELRSLGYASTIIEGAQKESGRADEIRGRIKEKEAEYDELNRKAGSYDFSASRSEKPYTADIDAISQNTKGGIQ